MIAVALSGGVDSSAAAIILHEKGETLMGVTLYLGQGVPAQVQIDRARALCKHLGIPHHVIDVSNEFTEIKD
jgi:tRNA-specific 2-thiouridylase